MLIVGLGQGDFEHEKVDTSIFTKHVGIEPHTTEYDRYYGAR